MVNGQWLIVNELLMLRKTLPMRDTGYRMLDTGY